jgi:hypothetical protein
MSTQISNYHDAFFKRVLGDPTLAGTFLRDHLPDDVTELLGPEQPQLMPGSFVDEQLREHHSDLLFRSAQDGWRCICIRAHGAQEHTGSRCAIAAVALCRSHIGRLVRAEPATASTAPCIAIDSKPGATRVEVLGRVRGLVWCRTSAIAAVSTLVPARFGGLGQGERCAVVQRRPFACVSEGLEI